MITVKTIRDVEEFARLKDPWNTLLENTSRESTFLTWEWLFTWWNHFNNGNELCLLLAFEENELVGIAPMMIGCSRKHGFRVTKMTSMAFLDADVSGFIYSYHRCDVPQALCKQIALISHRWDLVEIAEVPCACLDGLRLAEHFPADRFQIRCQPGAHIKIPLTCEWEKFYKGISSHFRRNMKRRQAMLQEAGKRYAIRYFRAGEIEEHHLETIFQIQKNSAYPETYSTQQEKDFNKELVARTKNKGQPFIAMIYIDDEPAGYKYGFIIDEKFEAWRSSIDRRFEQFTPGNLLLLEMAKIFCHSGIREIDMLRGEEDYKRKWNGEAQIYNHFHVIKKSSLKAMLLYAWLPQLKLIIKNRKYRINDVTYNNQN